MAYGHNENWFSLKKLRESKRQLTNIGQVPASWQVDNLKENCEVSIDELTKTIKYMNVGDWMAKEVLEHQVESIENILRTLRRTYPQNFI